MDKELNELGKAILHVMEKETQKIVEEEAKNAAARVEDRVRGMAGGIATRVASWVNFEKMFQNEIRITVRLPDRDNSANVQAQLPPTAPKGKQQA